MHVYNQQADEPIAALVDYTSSAATARIFYRPYLSAEHERVDSLGQSAIEATRQRVLSVFEKMGGFGSPAPC
jgi:hypothetical protein